MRNFILDFLRFLAFSTLLYTVFIVVWGNLAPGALRPNLCYNRGGYGHLYTRLNEVSEFQNVDLLFLGSSHAYRGFDTRIFENAGHKSFNLGSSAQTPLQTRVLVERYLKKLNPEVVIIEVYPSSFAFDCVESTLDIVSNDENDFSSLRLAFQTNHLKGYNAFLFSYMNDLIGIGADFVEGKEKDIDIYISGGFVQREVSFYTPESYEKAEWKMEEFQLKELEKCIQLIEGNGSEVVLVMAPVPDGVYNCYTNNQEVDSILGSYAEYKNFNYIEELNDSLHFYDGHHLNQNGVKIFNLEVIKYLEQRAKENSLSVLR